MAARSSNGGSRASASRRVRRLSQGADTTCTSRRAAALRRPLTPGWRPRPAPSRARDRLELGQVVQVVAGPQLHDEADRLRPSLAVDVGPLEVPGTERADEGEVPGPQGDERARGEGAVEPGVPRGPAVLVEGLGPVVLLREGLPQPEP